MFNLMHTFSVRRDILFVTTTIISTTKIQTTKLSILLRFYFHGVLEQLKTNFHTNFRFKRVLGFVIEYAWISKLLRDAAFTWRPRELSFRLKKVTFCEVKIIYDLRRTLRYGDMNLVPIDEVCDHPSVIIDWSSIGRCQSMLINSN